MRRFSSFSFGGATFLPTNINGCVLWLRSDLGVTHDGDPTYRVSSWADQSGNGNNLTQSTDDQKPVWTANQFGTYPGIYFDGTDDRMTATDDDTLDLSINGFAGFVVLIHESDPTNYNTILEKGDGSNSQLDYIFLHFFQKMWLIIGNDIDESITGTTATVADTKYLYTFLCNRTLDHARVRLNGTQEEEKTPLSQSGDINESSLVLGCRPSGAGSYLLNAYVAEIILYKNNLTTGQIDTVENYLNGRYAIY